MSNSSSTSPTAKTKSSRLHRQFFRNGDNHRAGADVSFADIKKVFGFRNITIGRWVTAKEQQIAANLFFDALCDLSDILALPPTALGLKQTLALAFGSGGRKGVCAHYTPAKRELSLAKNAGAGSLAHEWFHAFDNYIAVKAYAVQPRPQQFASSLYLQSSPLIPHPLNQTLQDCLALILLSPIKDELNPLVSASVAQDRRASTLYYSLPQELCARAFEAMVQDAPIKNEFLVSGTKISTLAKQGVYPSGQHRNAINVSLASYFRVLGKALNNQSK